jgi:endonuclease-3 related protein
MLFVRRKRGTVGFDKVYRRLRASRGPAGWWPAESAFEVCVGAILVQNTAWSNVEKSLRALRARGLLSFEALRDVPAEELAPIIRSSGCFNVKARRLRALLDFLGREYGGRVESMAREEPWALRAKLLAVAGIGRETADSIALYAAGLPLFVVDAYTRRVFSRLGLVRGDEPYDVLQRVFMDALPAEALLYNEYHAQVVMLAKDVCRAKPLCDVCPLSAVCQKRGVTDQTTEKIEALTTVGGQGEKPSGVLE